MTIPSLVASHRAKVFETQFKKRYSELNQALAMLQKDNITIYGNYRTQEIAKVLVTSFKDAELGNPRDYYNNYKNHSKGDVFNIRSLDDGLIIVNPEFFIFVNNNQPEDTIELFIDINGEKKPNIFGYDLFEFSLQEGDNLTTICPNNTFFCNDTGDHNGNGMSCSYFALTDKDYFKKLKW